MRVLQLHNHHASKGGAMEVLAHEAELLSAAGHAVQQYTLPAADDMGLSAVRAGAKAVWNVEAVRSVAAHIRLFRPDVVHVHTPFPLMSPAVFRPVYAAGLPAVATMHSFRYSCVVGTCVRDGQICEDCVGSRLKWAGVRHACYHDSRAASAALTLGLGLHRAIGTFDKAITRYLTLTGFARDLLIRDGFPADRIQVKPNSVPDPGFREEPTTSERRAVFVGRLVDLKGVRTLLDAWALTERGMQLVIAGDGQLRPLVEERAAADPSITYLGWIDEAAVTELMSSAEVVVVPSEWYEAGTPLVILRSLAVGTPVLMSDLENVSAEALEDGAGSAFPTGDASGLAESLSRLARSGNREGSRRRARRSYESRYSPQKNVRRLEQVYREAMAQPRR